MNKILFFVIAGILSLGAIYLLLGNYIYNKVVYRNYNRGKNSFTDQIENNSFDHARLERLKKEELKIKSDFGYELDAVLIYAEKKSVNTMIISHGLGGDKWTLMKIADIFLDLNFNVLSFDHRAQGLSGGKEISYGFYEKFDLEKVVELVKEKFPGGTIGVHGESLGGATALLHAGVINPKNNSVKFYIVDCPYSDLTELLKIRLREDYKLPDLYFLQTASKISKFRSGFHFDEVSPVSEIHNAKIPILFIHGKNDFYVPLKMTLDLYEKKTGAKEILLVENAAHAKSFSEAKQQYISKIKSFVNTILIGKSEV